MKIGSFDWEATGTQRKKHSPYDSRNKGMCVSTCVYDTITKEYTKNTYDIEYTSSSPYLIYTKEIENDLRECAWVAGMNIKYDLAWNSRYGIDILDLKLWDVQVFHFILTKQQNRFPSFDSILEYYGMPTKLDIVRTQYWEQGIDTDKVPQSILFEYCEDDTWKTLLVMQRQFQDFAKMDKKLQATVRIAMQDIRNLFEMERNGIVYDLEMSDKLAMETEVYIASLTNDIQEKLGIFDLPEEVQAVVNLNSGQHLSALLFGGVIKYDTTEVYTQTLKSGQVKVKTRKAVEQYICPRIFEPVPKTELKRNGIETGYYATNEDTLKKIRATKKQRVVLDMLLELSKLEKLNGTYFRGFPALLESVGWGNVVHSGFNQCVASTGRLSSTAPNMQNIPKAHKICFKSRFEGGKICNIDFAGLEWRAILEWSMDKAGIDEVFENRDAHADNQKAFGLPSRLIAKVFLFRAIYRGKAFAYANDPDFMEVSKSAAFWEVVIDNFYRKYKGISGVHDECLQEVYRTGEYVSPLTGRIYPYKKYEKRGVKDYNDSEVVNFPVQGFGADIVALFRCEIQRRIREAGYAERLPILATVHDSLVWDVADSKALDFLMETAHSVFEDLSDLWFDAYGYRLKVPHGYEVEVGDTYGTAKSVKECKTVLYKNKEVGVL
jgi:DNA polymerase I-like protein with 3'-5' exonuclease and polymerase domains